MAPPRQGWAEINWGGKREKAYCSSFPGVPQGAPQVSRTAERTSCAPAPGPPLPQERAWIARVPKRWSCGPWARSSCVTSPDPCKDPAGGCDQPPLSCLCASRVPELWGAELGFQPVLPIRSSSSSPYCMRGRALGAKHPRVNHDHFVFHLLPSCVSSGLSAMVLLWGPFPCPPFPPPPSCGRGPCPIHVDEPHPGMPCPG